MANQRAGIPAGWTWRDGRPRWKASPTLRKTGWRDADLKGPDGAWLARGASIDAAQAIVDGVALWRGGSLVPAALSTVAPPMACEEVGAGLAAPISPMSIGGLMEAYTGVPADAQKAPCKEFAGLKASTQRDYRGKLKRLVDVLAGYTILPARGDEAAKKEYEAAVAIARGLSIFTLEPEVDADGNLVSDLLYDAYHSLKQNVGLNQASGVMATTGAWLSWCRERKNRKIRNWASEVSRETPAGRLHVLTWEEIFALVTAADEMGLPSIGDSVILGVDLSWSQIDRLQLTWDRLVDNRAFTGAEGRQKTGRVGGTPLLDALGVPRVVEIRARQAKMAAHPTHVLWCELTNNPWKSDHYRHIFADVRTEAAKKVPGVLKATDQDLRDTAITIGRQAGLELDEICSRTLQSRKHVMDLLDRHYGEIGVEIADAGRDRLNAYLLARKVGQ